MMQRQPRREDRPHLHFVKERGCLVCTSIECDPHHIKMPDARVCKPMSSNIGMKADDRFTVPLCRSCHETLHRMGERKFWDAIRIDPVLIALALYSISGDHEAGDQLVHSASLAGMAVRG